VEEVTLARLKTLGCDFGQGYRWSPALPAQESAAFVQCGWFKVVIWFSYNNL
jgi:EAL domain-containing protein (putative c-di-GMP-specific phosphodiesterase class I)